MQQFLLLFPWLVFTFAQYAPWTSKRIQAKTLISVISQATRHSQSSNLAVAYYFIYLFKKTKKKPSMATHPRVKLLGDSQQICPLPSMQILSLLQENKARDNAIAQLEQFVSYWCMINKGDARWLLGCPQRLVERQRSGVGVGKQSRKCQSTLILTS